MILAPSYLNIKLSNRFVRLNLMLILQLLLTTVHMGWDYSWKFDITITKNLCITTCHSLQLLLDNVIFLL